MCSACLQLLMYNILLPVHVDMYVCMCMCMCADSFGMTKLHKDIAMYLMQCAGDEEYTDQAVVKVHTYTHTHTRVF